MLCSHRVIRLHVAYFHPVTNELITHPMMTAKRYFSSAFVTDLIGSPIGYYIIVTILSTLSYQCVGFYSLSQHILFARFVFCAHEIIMI